MINRISKYQSAFANKMQSLLPKSIYNLTALIFNKIKSFFAFFLYPINYIAKLISKSRDPDVTLDEEIQSLDPSISFIGDILNESKNMIDSIKQYQGNTGNANSKAANGMSFYVKINDNDDNDTDVDASLFSNLFDLLEPKEKGPVPSDFDPEWVMPLLTKFTVALNKAVKTSHSIYQAGKSHQELMQKAKTRKQKAALTIINAFSSNGKNDSIYITRTLRAKIRNDAAQNQN